MYKTIISVEDLYRNYEKPDWQVVDCRYTLQDEDAGRRAYSSSHIPGATYAHIDDDLSGEVITGKTGRHPLPDPQKLAETLGKLGITNDKQVVVYDAKGGSIAARLWWLLRWAGHEKVAVLNGGFPAWQSAAYPTQKSKPQEMEDTFVIKKTNDAMIADADEVERIREDEAYRLLDARTATRFSGEMEPIDEKAGHIPGAINAVYEDNFRINGEMRPKATLKYSFEGVLGKVKPENTVVYCGSGVTACYNILAMEYAGLEGARLYPGSWSEWITNKKRPIGKHSS